LFKVLLRLGSTDNVHGKKNEEQILLVIQVAAKRSFTMEFNCRRAVKWGGGGVWWGGGAAPLVNCSDVPITLGRLARRQHVRESHSEIFGNNSNWVFRMLFETSSFTRVQ